MQRHEIITDLLQVIGIGNGDATVRIMQCDNEGYASKVHATTIPANGRAGYAIGCELIKSNAVGGQCVTWKNHGTTTSCQFRPVGPVMGYGFNKASSKAFASGTAGLIATLESSIIASDIALASHSASDDTDQLISVITAANIVTITNSADPLAAHATHFGIMRSGCIPEYDIFAAGTVTTVGGNAAEAFTITGALATDLCLVQYAATDDTDTISKVVLTANTMTVTFSADPLTAHAVHYCILRPRGSFKPSHYVFAAGKQTTVGGAVAEAITVTGALATDVAIVNYAVTDDTDAIRKAVVTANTLTVTMSADPIVGHALSYAILRAY